MVTGGKPRGGRNNPNRMPAQGAGKGPGQGPGIGGPRAGAGWGGEAKGSAPFTSGPMANAIRALGHDPEHMASKAARVALLDDHLLKLSLSAAEETNQIRATVAMLARLDPVTTKAEVTGANGAALLPPVLNIVGVAAKKDATE